MGWSLYEAARNTSGARRNYFVGSGDMALALVELTGPLAAAQPQTLERHGATVLRVWGSTVYVRTTFDRLPELGDLREDLKSEVAKSETSAEGEYFQWIERTDLHGVFKVLVKNASLRVRPVAFHLFVLHDAEVGPDDRRLLTARRSLLGVVQPIENVIAVGAVQYPQGAMWEYSSQGPTGDDRIKPDLVGYSPVPSDLKRKADGTAAAHGTSFTAPQVAAAAALLRAKNPALSAAEIKRILMQSASAPPGILGALFGTRYAYGAGILNVRGAVESALGIAVTRDVWGGTIFLHP